MKWTDCHAHPTDERYGDSWSQVWRSAKSRGVQRVLCGGMDPTDWQKQQRLHSEDHAIVPCFGLHPYFVAMSDRATCEDAMDQLQAAAGSYLLLGEVGIDKRPPYAPALSQQIEYLERQLDLAIVLGKVPVYHIVRGHAEVQPTLKARAGRIAGGIVHAFTGNPQTARFYLDHGCWLSIGTHLLRRDSDALRAVVRMVPLDRMLVESDAPDGRMPGQSDLGTPQVIVEIAKAICEIKSIPLSHFSKVLDASVVTILRQQNKES